MARFVRRSWGWYFVLLNHRQFKVKLLRFKKEGKLSNQYHNHRSELWLFLQGLGTFFVGECRSIIGSGEWNNITVRTPHGFVALIPTYVLEIQYGESCNEEDIVRI